MEDIAKIANYLYNTNNIGAYDHGYEDSNGETLQLDYKKAALLGFNTKEFEISANDEGITGVSFRQFKENISLQPGTMRTVTSRYFICTID